MGQLRLYVRKQPRQIPPFAKHLPNIVLPTDVVREVSLVALVAHDASENQIEVINAQHSGVQGAHHRHDVQQHVKLIDGAVEAEEEDRHGEDHLDDGHRKLEGYPAPDEEAAVAEGVRRAEEQVPQEHDEVPVIVIADAAAGEHAVVVALQDARVAGVAVPGAGRREALADRAQPPPVRHRRGAHRHYAPADAGVAQHRVREVTYDIQHDEATEDEVELVRQVLVPVQSRQYYPQSEPVHERRYGQHEGHRQQIADSPRPHFFPDYHRRAFACSRNYI